MEGTAGPRVRGPSRKLIITAVAVAAIVIVAAAAVLLLTQPGGPLDGPDGGDGGDGDQNGRPGTGDEQSVLPVELRDGDFIEYTITMSEGFNGTMRMTYRNITADSYDVVMVQTIEGQAFTFTWRADANETLGSRENAEGEPEDFGELVGEETIDTPLGARRADHYRNTSDDGSVVDCYIGHDVPIVYRTVTTSDDGTTVIELNDTNIEEVRDANQ